MSKHTFSVLTSDLRRDPSILDRIMLETGARTGYQGRVTTVEHGPVTTVTALAA